MTMIRVSDEMKNNMPRIKCGMSLVDVVTIFTQHHINAAPVVNSQDELIGFVSESDCMHALISGSYYCDKPALVNEVMTKMAISVTPEDSIIDVAIRMAEDNFSVYPVIENGKLVGVLTRRDILQALAKSHSQCGQSAKIM
jgi:CBS domain-containing protein